jgi:hypothetical protein
VPGPPPPPIGARIKINGQTINATSVTMNDAGAFVATFPSVPAGTGGVIEIEWNPTGDKGTVDNITAQ